jgi:hypothetical protein
VRVVVVVKVQRRYYTVELLVSVVTGAVTGAGRAWC